MAKKKGDYPIPFDSQGNLLHYPESKWEEIPGAPADADYWDRHAHVPPTWRGNFAFDDTLEWHGFNRGRSAAYLILRSVTTGVEYPMFLKNLDEVMRRGGFAGNRITGTWTFTKFGENYGVRLADEGVKV